MNELRDIVKVNEVNDTTIFVELSHPVDIDYTKKYDLVLTAHKSNRSLEQNRYMWLLIGEIDRKLNGGLSKDPIQVYIHLLQKANAKYDFIYILPEAVKTMKKRFRAMQKIADVEVNGVMMENWQVFYGSSTMNTKEMSRLIDCALDYAYEVGVPDIDNYWQSMLKGDDIDN